MLGKIGYGLVRWVIPYVTAIPLLPFTKMPLDRCFIEIGAPCLAMAAPTVVAGFLLERRSRA